MEVGVAVHSLIRGYATRARTTLTNAGFTRPRLQVLFAHQGIPINTRWAVSVAVSATAATYRYCTRGGPRKLPARDILRSMLARCMSKGRNAGMYCRLKMSHFVLLDRVGKRAPAGSLVVTRATRREDISHRGRRVCSQPTKLNPGKVTITLRTRKINLDIGRCSLPEAKPYEGMHLF